MRCQILKCFKKIELNDNREEIILLYLEFFGILLYRLIL